MGLSRHGNPKLLKANSMRTRVLCLQYPIAAAALLLLQIVEARAGQNQDQWMVFDRDSASGLQGALADSALTPEQIRDFRILGPSDDRAVARYFPELEETLHHVLHDEAGRCGGYTLHGSLAAALAEADNPLYSSTYLDRSGVAPAAIDQQVHVVPALELVDAERIVDTIEWLQDMDTRYYLTQEGQHAALALQAQWEGYRSGRSDFSVTRFEHPWAQDSVIATIEGSVHPDDIVLLGGHLDSINVSGRLAPGADDNASGIAVVSEVLRVVLASGFRPQRTLQLIAYAAEEVGLRGSRAIAREYQLTGKNVVAAMQLDLTGFSGSPHDMYFVTDYVSTDLTNFVKNLIDEYNGPGPHEITFGDTACGYACSDHAAWTEVGVPAVHPFETLVEDRNPAMHTAYDTLDRMDSTGRKSALFAKLGLEFMMEVSKADDAPSVTVAFESAAYTVTEGGTVNVPVRLSEALTPARRVSIGLTATPGLGATDVDYSVPTSVTLEGGKTRALVEVVSLPDAEADHGETVTLGFGAELATDVAAGRPATSTVTILDPTDRGRTFTDYPIRPGATPLKAIHFRELRARIAALRSREGLPPMQWTDPVLRAGVTPVRQRHVIELRAALDAVYDATGRLRPIYTEPVLTAGVSTVKAVHVAELRRAVLMLE